MATIEEVLKTDLAFTDDFKVTATGDIDIISGLANIKQALFNRLVTSPGSLIHRPTYGVGIKDYQNSPSSLASQQLLAKKIQEQFLQDERIEAVTGVQIKFNDLTPEKTTILVKVKVKGYDESAFAFIPFGEGV
jgi:phage baseplate assembly protein W